MNHQPRAAANSVIWAAAGISVIAIAGFHLARSTHHSSVKLDTSYQALLLANGSAYFGHLQNFDLTDVFYIASQKDPTTKQKTELKSDVRDRFPLGR